MRTLLLLFLALSAVGTQAADIAGRYADKGTAIPSEAGQAAAEMSLHALLQLDLDFERVRDRYVETDYVEFRQGQATLEARMCAADDSLRSHGAWSTGEGYSTKDDTVILQLRGPRHGGDAFILVMSLVGEKRLLQVEVSRATTTNFGPTARQVGTYLFPRLD